MNCYEDYKHKYKTYQGGRCGIAAFHRYIAVQTRDSLAGVGTCNNDAMDCGQLLDERRFAMSRRHYIGSGSAPANLIFYAPLTENDMTDHISGEALHTQSTNVTWNSTYGMYNIQKSGTGGAYFQNLNLGLPFTSSDFSQVSCTCVFDFILTNSSDKKYANLVGIGKGYYSSAASHRFPLLYVNAIGTTINIGVKYKIAWVLENSTFSLYVDDVLVPLTTPNLSDNFNYTECNTYVSLATGNWSGNNGGGCFGNIRIYDRALTVSEVSQL